MRVEALYFTSPECCVCDVIKPKVREMLANNFPEVKWSDIDSSKQPKLSAENAVFVSPVLILKAEGKEYCRFIRNFSIHQVAQKLSRLYRLMNA